MSHDSRVRTYFDGAPDAIIVTDASGRIEYASRRGSTLLETDGPLVARELQEFIHADDRGRLLELLEAGRSGPTDIRLRRAGGEVALWVEATAEAIPEAAGGHCVVLALRDVTGRKSAELELLEAKATAEQANQRLVEAMRDLELLAATDELTGLWNRRHFEQAASVELARCHRYGHVASLIMLDVDHFKGVNDRFGHDVGDRALVAVCRAIAATARGSDTACRWGGEEFVVLASSVGEGGAWRLAERIRVAIEALEPSPVPGGITVSAGVAQLGPGESLERWVERADQALYRAKERGRNRVAVAEPVAEIHDHRVVQLVWDASYECGDALIDEQHRELFLLGNRVLDAAMGAAPVAVLQQELARLLDHIARHFTDEETMLERIGYADREHHSIIHRTLLEEASRMRGRLAEGDLTLQDVVTFLVLRVVNEHVVHADTLFFPAVAAAR